MGGQQILPLFEHILEKELLHTVFQPIVHIESGHIIGYEGLIRGPAGTDLEFPTALFSQAKMLGRQQDLERLCCRILWREFSALSLPGKLFLNLSLDMLQQAHPVFGRMDTYMEKLKVDAKRVVIEITEDQRVADYPRLRRIANLYNARGFTLGIDDLGEGFASLRLWLELQPQYVKVDMAFVQGIDRDARKCSFLKSIQHIAIECGTKVIIEGIETEAEFRVVKNLGIALGQGYYLSRPNAKPPRSLAVAIA